MSGRPDAGTSVFTEDPRYIYLRPTEVPASAAAGEVQVHFRWRLGEGLRT